MSDFRFNSACGVTVTRREEPLDEQAGLGFLVDRLDERRGVYLSSGVEDPDRYARFDFGFVDPPLELISRENRVSVRALNRRGEVILEILKPSLSEDAAVTVAADTPRRLDLEIAPTERVFAEEERSLQPSVFTPLRTLLAAFEGIDDSFLGLYGAFGYDLIFQFERMPLRIDRSRQDKDMHLYLPDRMYVLDRQKEIAALYTYEFARDSLSTLGIPFETGEAVALPAGSAGAAGGVQSDLADQEYEGLVNVAREHMRVGDIFEVVLGRTFRAPFAYRPSAMYHLMRRINPSPYEFLCQFGDEQLVGASPEMFVRVDGDRIESCPISGTIRRGTNAMEDADRIRELYNSYKDEVELTMCTDVDRNDKSRICRPGTVKLLTRRLIERYAGLFHTVDHVEGRLREGLNGLDAFLSHMWAVTLTGAPKRKAVGLIERYEDTPRLWYGGAVGAILLNGNVNTGITIRTAHLKDGHAEYRAGATLVWDSVPGEEEQETRVKATAFFRALETLDNPPAADADERPLPFPDASVVMIDNEDSFVHTLADYFRQTGATVKTFRAGPGVAETVLAEKPDLVVHSPGPGRPADFGVPDLVRRFAEAGLPQFGVCLGLQGIVEAFGGELDLLEEPRHGKTWALQHDGSGLFEGLAPGCTVGAYHSIVAFPNHMPEDLEVTARNERGDVMAIRHRGQPVAAVQFHPESILSMGGDAGHRLIENALRVLLA